MTFGVLATGCGSLKEANALMEDMDNAGFRFFTIFPKINPFFFSDLTPFYS
jgi:hypothetical protein